MCCNGVCYGNKMPWQKKIPRVRGGDDDDTSATIVMYRHAWCLSHCVASTVPYTGT